MSMRPYKPGWPMLSEMPTSAANAGAVVRAINAANRIFFHGCVLSSAIINAALNVPTYCQPMIDAMPEGVNQFNATIGTDLFASRRAA